MRWKKCETTRDSSEAPEAKELTGRQRRLRSRYWWRRHLKKTVDRGLLVALILIGWQLPIIVEELATDQKDSSQSTSARAICDDPLAKYIKPESDGSSPVNTSSTIERDAYIGSHTFGGNDIVDNLIANTEQLIGKWLTEVINGPVTEAIRFLTGCLTVMTAPPITGTTSSDAGAEGDVAQSSKMFMQYIFSFVRIGMLLALVALIVRAIKEGRKRAAQVALEAHHSSGKDHQANG